jgi:hypothetical protein
MGWPAVSCCAVAVLAKGRAMLMPSTPSAYPQVISRHLASFRVVQFYVSAAHDHFWGGFDSRQLHWKRAALSRALSFLAWQTSTGCQRRRLRCQTTLGSSQRQQSSNGLAVDATTIDQLTPRVSRRREVGVKPETTSVRDSCTTRGRGCFRCRSIKSSTSARVMRQVRPTRYPDNSPRVKRRDNQRTPSVISGGRTIFATS